MVTVSELGTGIRRDTRRPERSSPHGWRGSFLSARPPSLRWLTELARYSEKERTILRDSALIRSPCGDPVLVVCTSVVTASAPAHTVWLKDRIDERCQD